MKYWNVVDNCKSNDLFDFQFSNSRAECIMKQSFYNHTHMYTHLRIHTHKGVGFISSMCRVHTLVSMSVMGVVLAFFIMKCSGQLVKVTISLTFVETSP